MKILIFLALIPFAFFGLIFLYEVVKSVVLSVLLVVVEISDTKDEGVNELQGKPRKSLSEMFGFRLEITPPEEGKESD